MVEVQRALGGSGGDDEAWAVLDALEKARGIRILATWPGDGACRGQGREEEGGSTNAKTTLEVGVLPVRGRLGALRRHRRRERGRLRAVKRYAGTRKCRRAFILEYFGEDPPPGPCGGCDRCGFR